MINISPISEIQPDLVDVLHTKGQCLRAFDCYGIAATTGRFSSETVAFCNIIAERLATETTVIVPIAPGIWQPGAMRYIIYLIK